MSLAARALLLFSLLAVPACGRAADQPETGDPLAAAIEASRAQVKPADQPALAKAEEDLRAGRRLLALQRFTGVKENLAVAAYLGQHRAGNLQDFEAEWRRMGGVLRADLKKPFPDAFKEVEPAAVRALAEAALPQIRGYYEASLEYGRNTMPDQGLYYLAGAQAQRDLTAFYRTLSEPTSRHAPPVRPLHAELDALETGVSGGADARRLRDLDARLSSGDVDHSLGRLFLEAAQADAANAGAIVDDVLPRYFAALEPAKPEKAGPAPRVTVTLVRWPYT